MNEKLGQEPAFPKSAYVSNEGSIDPPQEGMSKRFYAACVAMQGIISNSELRDCLLMDSKQPNLNPERISPEAYLVKNAYEYADELLKQEQL